MKDKLTLDRKPYLIFDFDGTIADSWMTMLQIAGEMADEIGFDRSALDHIEEVRSKGMIELLNEFGISPWELPWYAFKVRRRFTGKLGQIKPVDGMVFILRELKEEGFRMGVISSNSVKNIKKWLTTYEMEDLFEFVITSPLFGKQRLIKKMLKRKGYRVDEAVYVGDETRDTESANKAGIPSIAVTWGFNNRIAHETRDAEWIVETPAGLISALEEMAV